MKKTMLALAAGLMLAVPSISGACPAHQGPQGYYTAGYNYYGPAYPARPMCQPVCPRPVCQPVCNPCCDPCRRSGLLGLGILGIL
jgi:hypothetical protein